MSTLGVITDTHIPQRMRSLPPRVFEAFRGVDMILHAGDINSCCVLDELAQIAPVEAVAGNADLFQRGLPLTRVIEIAGKRIGLAHGHGGWSRYLLGKLHDRLGYSEEYYLNIVQRSFGSMDAIVFGHTHRYFRAIRAGTLFFNPGPVAPDYYNTYGPQVGLLHVTPASIESEIASL